MNCFDRFFLCCVCYTCTKKIHFGLRHHIYLLIIASTNHQFGGTLKLFQTNMYRYSSQYHWIFFNGCIKFLFFLSVMMPSKIFVECKHLADSFFFLFKQLLYVVWRLKLYCFPVNKMVHVSTTCFCHCMFLLSSLLSIALMFCIFISKTTVTF